MMKYIFLKSLLRLNNVMKKSFLYAYDRQNLGDDLFVHTITRRYPDVQFYMWSDRKNKKTFADLPNLKVIDRDSRFVHALNRLRPSLVARYKAMIEGRCDAVVYIGGSIFMEYPNWEQICSWWDWTARNRPFYVLGANFGPWHTEDYRRKMAEIFGNMQDVCFRDRYSYELFRDVDTVRVAPDILFSYPMPQVQVREKQVFVSVINCAGRDESHGLSSCDSRYVANMANLLNRYLEDGCNLILASFCKEEGDEDGVRKILEAMGCQDDPRVRVLCYDGTNAAELTQAIAESDLVVATRFHAAILALAAGRPVLPIVYSDKTLHVLEDLGFDGVVYDIRQDEEWKFSGVDKKVFSVKTIVRCAQNHFAILDRQLEES